MRWDPRELTSSWYNSQGQVHVPCKFLGEGHPTTVGSLDCVPSLCPCQQLETQSWTIKNKSQPYPWAGALRKQKPVTPQGRGAHLSSGLPPWAWSPGTRGRTAVSALCRSVTGTGFCQVSQRGLGPSVTAAGCFEGEAASGQVRPPQEID